MNKITIQHNGIKVELTAAENPMLYIVVSGYRRLSISLTYEEAKNFLSNPYYSTMYPYACIVSVVDARLFPSLV